MSLYSELKRRNVIKVVVAYVVAAWLVMQVADVLLNNIVAPPWVFHVLLLFLALGFPLAVFLAWAYELTPDGIMREEDVGPNDFEFQDPGRKLDFVIIGVLLLALSYLIYDKFVLSKGGRAAPVEANEAIGVDAGEVDSLAAMPNSIAVLPFVNTSDDSSNEYFSDGMSEELLNLLAKIPELRVISRTSAFSFKGKQIKLVDVARELKVRYILEGSVRKDGNKVRISARLIDAHHDTELWSGAYERTLNDVFFIQNSIAEKVVSQLKVPLLGTMPTARETDTEAYSLYLQARHVAQQMIPEALQQSTSLYKQALAIDPDYAAAWQGLASNYLNQAAWMLPTAEATPLAFEAASKAVAVDPDYGPAYAVLGLVAMSQHRDLTTAAANLQRALELDPNDTDSISAAATLAMGLGRLEQSIALAEVAVSRDPASARRQLNLSNKYFEAGRFADAIAAARTALNLSPGRNGAHARIAAALLLQGKAEEALAVNQRESSLPRRLLGEVMIYHALGRSAQSDEALDQLIADWEQELSYNIAYVLAFRGETDRAFRWLEKAIDYDDSGLFEITANSLFANLHDDPRWPEFLDRIGMAPAQLEAIRFDVPLT